MKILLIIILIVMNIFSASVQWSTAIEDTISGLPVTITVSTIDINNPNKKNYEYTISFVGEALCSSQPSYTDFSHDGSPLWLYSRANFVYTYDYINNNTNDEMKYAQQVAMTTDNFSAPRDIYGSSDICNRYQIDSVYLGSTCQETEQETRVRVQEELCVNNQIIRDEDWTYTDCENYDASCSNSPCIVFHADLGAVFSGTNEKFIGELKKENICDLESIDNSFLESQIALHNVDIGRNSSDITQLEQENRNQDTQINTNSNNISQNKLDQDNINADVNNKITDNTDNIEINTNTNDTQDTNINNNADAIAVNTHISRKNEIDVAYNKDINNFQSTAIQANTDKNTNQDALINANSVKNTSQDTSIEDNTQKNTIQDTSIAENTQKNTNQDVSISENNSKNISQDTAILDNENVNTNQQTKLDELETNIATQQTTNTNLQNSINYNNENINQNIADITTLNETTTTFQANFTNLETDVNSRINANQVELGDLQLQIDGIEGGSYDSAIDDAQNVEINTNKDAINHNFGLIQNNLSQLDTQSQRINTNMTDISANTERSIKNETDMSQAIDYIFLNYTNVDRNKKNIEDNVDAIDALTLSTDTRFNQFSDDVMLTVDERILGVHEDLAFVFEHGGNERNRLENKINNNTANSLLNANSIAVNSESISSNLDLISGNTNGIDANTLMIAELDTSTKNLQSSIEIITESFSCMNCGGSYQLACAADCLSPTCAPKHHVVNSYCIPDKCENKCPLGQEQDSTTCECSDIECPLCPLKDENGNDIPSSSWIQDSLCRCILKDISTGGGGTFEFDDTAINENLEGVKTKLDAVNLSILNKPNFDYNEFKNSISDLAVNEVTLSDKIATKIVDGTDDYTYTEISPDIPETTEITDADTALLEQKASKFFSSSLVEKKVEDGISDFIKDQLDKIDTSFIPVISAFDTARSCQDITVVFMDKTHTAFNCEVFEEIIPWDLMSMLVWLSTFMFSLFYVIKNIFI